MSTLRYPLLLLVGAVGFVGRPAIAQRPATSLLEPGKPVERELKGEETHAYTVARTKR